MTTSDHKAITDVLHRVDAAWAANDADAFADLYRADGTVVLPGRNLVGREAIRADMKEKYAGVYRGTTSRNDAESIRLLGSDAAVVVGLSGIMAPGERTVAPEFQRRATWVLSRQDGTWLVDAYHNSPV